MLKTMTVTRKIDSLPERIVADWIQSLFAMPCSGPPERWDLTPVDSTVSYLGDQATAVGRNEVRRRTDFNCRSVYLPVIRNDLPELFDVFDFANPHISTGERPKTTVPTQGLFMLNDSMVMAAAEATAKRIVAETPSNRWMSGLIGCIG